MNEKKNEVIHIKTRILSPTAINMYLSCPYKFYLRYIKKLRTKPSIHLIRGQLVHQALHQFHKDRKQLLLQRSPQTIHQELLNRFDHLWKNATSRLNALELSDEEIGFYYHDSRQMLVHYGDWFCKNNMPIPDLSEAKIFSNILSLMGIIDAVYQRPNEIILVDYKTSKHADITEDITRQAALYALLYLDRYQKLPDVLRVHFLKEPGDPVPVHIDEWLLEYAKILVQSVREKTTSENENDYPCTCGGFCQNDFTDP